MVNKLLCIIACGVLISSCAPVTSSNIGGGQALPQKVGDYAYSNYVLINNRALLRDLQITDIKSRMVNGLMQVQVLLDRLRWVHPTSTHIPLEI